jgi:hypothetical protein
MLLQLLSTKKEAIASQDFNMRMSEELFLVLPLVRLRGIMVTQLRGQHEPRCRVNLGIMPPLDLKGKHELRESRTSRCRTQGNSPQG